MKAMWLDLSVCIGCRACQVACKEWNDLPSEPTVQSGGYENPRGLTGDTWKQVRFVEKTLADGTPVWLFLSDSCKHCQEAPCLTACPTDAIYRTDEGFVLIDASVCNGNAHCVPACPFDVIHVGSKRVAAKCTFCHDRVGAGAEPACAKVCPTDCIQFGEREDLLGAAHARRDLLHSRGETALLYGESEVGGLNVFYLLQDEPEVYGLPRDPVLPVKRLGAAWAATATAAAAILGSALAFLIA